MTRLAEALSALLPVSAVDGLPDEDLLAAANDVEAPGRTIDALRVSVAGSIAARSRTADGAVGLAARKGCRSANELLQRITRISGATGAARLSLAALTRQDVMISGTPIPSEVRPGPRRPRDGPPGHRRRGRADQEPRPLKDRIHPEALDAALAGQLGAMATGVEEPNEGGEPGVPPARVAGRDIHDP
jgi:hypothetical protein